MPDQKLDEVAIFAAAAELAGADQAVFLDQACRGDLQLRERIGSYLRCEQQAGPLDVGIPEIAAFGNTLLQSPPIEEPSDTIGPYTLRERLGEGGMGIVFVAEQREPVHRTVALKIIKPGMDSREVVARFEAERQALAMMSHPNIAKVFDGGATDTGRPYFVMELVKGIPITEFCDEQKLDIGERLKLFIKVCEAVQHAHQKGIIHRDLKPSNVLVELHDVKAVPKVIDFGIAKATNQQLTQQTVYTQFSQLIGTPLYMSPEQAQLSGLDVDTRSDVYSLGVMLYELLSGSTPFDRESLSKAGFDELRRIIREDEPPWPSQRISTLDNKLASTISDRRRTDPRKLSLSIQCELDWIVMKALEKDRTQRYDSAGALAADIRRYLSNEAVQACPPSAAYRLRKFVRRNNGILTTAVLVFVALVAGTGVATWQAVRATNARKLADEYLTLADRRLQTEREAHFETEQALAAARESEKQAEDKRAELAELLRFLISGFQPVGATFGPDGRLYVTSTLASEVLCVEVFASTPTITRFVAPSSGGLKNPQSLTFGPDSNGDGTPDLYVTSLGEDPVLEYDGATGKFLRAFVRGGDGLLSFPNGLTFVANGDLYVAGFETDNVVRYNRSTGQVESEFVVRNQGGLRRPQTILLGPDGNLYVASFETNSVLRYDGGSGRFLGAFVRDGTGGLTRPEGMAFGPDGNLYVSSNGGSASAVLRFDGTTGEFMDEIPKAKGVLQWLDCQAILFADDGSMFVTSLNARAILRADFHGDMQLREVVTDRDVANALSVDVNGDIEQFFLADQWNGGRVPDIEELERHILENRQRCLGTSHPDTLAAMVGLGRILSRQEKWDDAVSIYRQALEVDPSFEDARAGLRTAIEHLPERAESAPPQTSN